MPRYIDADALNAYIKSAECNSVGKALQAIDNAPAVSHNEVRGSGNWHDVCVWGNGAHLVASMRCSVCNRYHNEVYHYGDPTETARYCPNCGVKMEVSEDA